MDYDVVIIGAGLSGLAAGIRLARNGKSVLIVEAHTVPGGLNSYFNHAGRTIDVGLHAMTDFAGPHERTAPLNKILRRVGIHNHELDLAEQLGSRVLFPRAALRFTNDPNDLKGSIATAFPAQLDGFERLDTLIAEYNDAQPFPEKSSGRETLASFLTDPALTDMLLLPLAFYGSSAATDMDFHDLAVRWKSVYHAGLARPQKGMRGVVGLLADRFAEADGKLVLGRPVQELLVDAGRINGVVLAGGQTVVPGQVISSAGFVETMRLRSDEPDDVHADDIGRVSFVEFIGFLDTLPADLGIRDSMIFFSINETLNLDSNGQLADCSTGAICFPNNFHYQQPPREGIVRITARADFREWAKLTDRSDYRDAKVQVMARLLRHVTSIVPDFRPHLNYYELYTPRTIKRFARRVEGAVNGTVNKLRDGCTDLENLFICGTDQGLNGIVGAMFSGILMANLHCLAPKAENKN